MSIIIKCDLCGKLSKYNDSFCVEVTDQRLLNEDNEDAEYRGECDVCLDCAEKITRKRLRSEDTKVEKKLEHDDLGFSYYLTFRKER